MKHKRIGIRPKTRFNIFKRDNFKCVYCGAESEDRKLYVDHIIPVAVGGNNNIDNLVTACFECNIGKGAKPLTNTPSSDIFKPNKTSDLLKKMLLTRIHHLYVRHNIFIDKGKTVEERLDILKDFFRKEFFMIVTFEHQMKVYWGGLVLEYGLYNIFKALYMFASKYIIYKKDSYQIVFTQQISDNMTDFCQIVSKEEGIV